MRVPVLALPDAAPRRGDRPALRADRDESANALVVRRYQGFEFARGLSTAWDALVDEVDGDIFATFDWCELWWKHFGHGRRLELWIAQWGDKLVAVLPLFRERLRWGPLSLRAVRVIGTDMPFSKVGLAINKDATQRVVAEVVERMWREEPWDVLQMAEIPGYATYADSLADALSSSDKFGSVNVNRALYPQMVFNLPETFDAYLQKLSLKERRNLRRDERQLIEEEAVKVHEPATEADASNMLSELVSLHTAQWQRRGFLGQFADWNGSEAFQREIVERLHRLNRLLLTQVRGKRGLLATEWGAAFAGRLHWIIGGRANGVTSRAGFAEVVRFAQRRGIALVDGLGGRFDYKRRLGADEIQLQALLAVSRSPISRVRWALYRMATWVVDCIYFRLWVWRAAPYVRKNGPRLLKKYAALPRWKRHARSQFAIKGAAGGAVEDERAGTE